MVTKNPDICNRKSGCFGCLKKIVYTVLVVLLRYFYIKLHRKRKPWVQGVHGKSYLVLELEKSDRYCYLLTTKGKKAKSLYKSPDFFQMTIKSFFKTI